MLYINTDILLKVALNKNNTGLRVIRYNWKHCWKWRQAPIKLVNMLYIITDMLLTGIKHQ
jgi:hypothetical protein